MKNSQKPLLAGSRRPGELDDPVDLFPLREMGGVDQERIGGSNRLGGVHFITQDDLPRFFGNLIIHWDAAESFDKPATGPFPRVSNEEDLQRCIGKDHGPDIAAIDHDVKRFSGLSNLIIHPVAHTGHFRNTRHAGRDNVTAHLCVSVFPVQ